MNFNNYTTIRDAFRRSLPKRLVGRDTASFYRQMISDASRSNDGQLSMQARNELEWERLRRPYYNVWPSIIPMLTRLNLDLNSDLIHLPMPSLCIRLPEDPAKNPLKFDWKGEHIHICSILMGDLYQGKSMSLFLDVGETLPGRYSAHPCLNFHRRPGLTVEQALANLAWVSIDEDSVAVPRALMTDCLRLCCTLCLLDEDPSVISPDVLAPDRAKYDATGDKKYEKRAYNRGKVGWDVGRHIEKCPHRRRSHMAIVRIGPGRKDRKIIWRKGAVIHRDAVEKIPTGFLGLDGGQNLPGNSLCGI